MFVDQGACQLPRSYHNSPPASSPQSVPAPHIPPADCAKLAAVETVAEKIRAAGDLLLADLRAPGSNMNERINATLNGFLTWPFRVDAASLVDTESLKAKFDTVIYSGSVTQSQQATTIASDAAACVIHAVRDLRAGEMRAGYGCCRDLPTRKITEQLKSRNLKS